MQSVFSMDTLTVLASVYSYDTTLHALAYKLVVKKVCSIVALVNEEFCITCSLLDAPLARLSHLPFHPPDFVPGNCFTQECADKLGLNPTNWLWPEELKLICWLVHEHESAFAWVPME